MRESPIKVLSAAEGEDVHGSWFEIASEDHFWFQWRFQAFSHQIQSLGVETNVPLKVLEVGCGHGVLRSQLESSTAWVVDGADLDRSALAGTKPLRGESLLYNIHDRNDDLKGKYDALFLFDVLEHIPDPVGFLQSALFHLKPGGRVFINVPALEFFRGTFDRAVGHLRRYNAESLRQTLRSGSLEESEIRYWGFPMLPLLFLRNILPAPKDPQKIIQRGLQPPGVLTEGILRILMRLEGTLYRKPFLGTSILAAARKPA